MEGILVSIHVAAAAKARMQTLSEVLAVPGAGLEGDRYFMRQGTFYKPEPDFELTLIEAEAIEALGRGVALNHLVGKEFSIGGVRARGIRLCEPCSHLEAVTGLTVIKGLRHRGGLRAQILSEGVIRAGDGVR
jgi:hypothetical protein